MLEPDAPSSRIAKAKLSRRGGLSCESNPTTAVLRILIALSSLKCCLNSLIKLSATRLIWTCRPLIPTASATLLRKDHREIRRSNNRHLRYPRAVQSAPTKWFCQPRFAAARDCPHRSSNCEIGPPKNGQPTVPGLPCRYFQDHSVPANPNARGNVLPNCIRIAHALCVPRIRLIPS